MSRKGELQIFVDAGFRENRASSLPKSVGTAGIGVWIPAIATGISMAAQSSDNNEAESLAILLGVVIGNLMGLTQTRVLTDSRVCSDRLSSGELLSGSLLVVQNSLLAGGGAFEWRSREVTSLADFFATLALEGKSLIATASNAKNPADKFRPILKLRPREKNPMKDATVKWLTPPSTYKSPLPSDFEKLGIAKIAPNIITLLGHELPCAEFQFLIEHFRNRAG